MNRGDTLTLMLDYEVNGAPLVEGAYDEIELQLNNQNSSRAIKKLLSSGDIKWATVDYDDGTFTGYIVSLSQTETFSLVAGQTQVQLRIKIGDEVGSSETSMFTLGSVLSSRVI